jgi:hypothetical protein
MNPATKRHDKSQKTSNLFVFFRASLVAPTLVSSSDRMKGIDDGNYPLDI